MDKVIENNYNHYVQINERKNCTIFGIKKLDNFTSNEFIIESNMGYILVKGENLELLKLDTFGGSVSIKGKINSLNYIEDKKNKKGESLITKLFK